MPKPVLTKSNFVYRYQQGEFGNHAPTWLTLQDFMLSKYPGLVHLRNRVAGGQTFYNLHPKHAESVWLHAEAQSQWYCSAMAPHRFNLFQGELHDGIWGWNLYGSFAKGLPMRDALAKSGRSYSHTQAKAIIDRFFNSASKAWIEYLLDTYPKHVIEFSAFSKCWGTVPGENVVIWEVRLY